MSTDTALAPSPLSLGNCERREDWGCKQRIEAWDWEPMALMALRERMIWHSLRKATQTAGAGTEVGKVA